MDRREDGRKDRQTLFYRTLLAVARGLISSASKLAKLEVSYVGTAPDINIVL